MRKVILTTVLCMLLSGAFALGSHGTSAAVVNDTENPSLPITYLPSTNAEELIALSGTSHYSAKRSIPPVVQVDLTASGQMLLSWAAIPGASGYNVYRANVPEPIDPEAWTVLTTLPPETLSYLVNPEQSREFFYVSSLAPDQNTLVLIEGGTFHNGTSNVTVSSFYLDTYELTQAEYQAVMGAIPNSEYGVGSNYPVYYVSWFDTIEYSNRRSMLEGLIPCYSYGSYGTNPATWPSGWNTNSDNHDYVSCNWTANGYRLPTEMEWMHAARGGNLTNNYTYSGSSDMDVVGWYWDNWGYPYYSTHTVGSKLANELGLYDMSGNVREWCWDIHGDYPSDSQNDPMGSDSGSYRVVRGGSWSEYVSNCTVSFRNLDRATSNSHSMGFRICRGSP